MSPKKLTAQRIDVAVIAAMRDYKEREGVPFSVQIEKGVTEWLKKRGVVVRKKTASRHAGTRRKA